MFSANGIASTSNGTIYVSSTSGLKLVMYEKQDDGSLILQDSVLCGMNNCSHSFSFDLLTANTATPIDNISIDKNGAVWAAGEYTCLAIVYPIIMVLLLQGSPKRWRCSTMHLIPLYRRRRVPGGSL